MVMIPYESWAEPDDLFPIMGVCEGWVGCVQCSQYVRIL